jgi:anti-sigma regulatory factor (Ser/Thr protein kinase)
MNEIPELLSLFGENSATNEWKPLLAQFPGRMLTLVDGDFSAASAIFNGMDFVPRLVLLGSDLYTARRAELMQYLHKNCPNAAIIILALTDCPSIPLESMIADGVRHLAAMDPGMEFERFRLLLRTIAANVPWEVSSYLDLNADVREFCLFDGKQKESVIDRIEKLVVGGGSDLNVVRQKGTILADEMIENAIQAAPADAVIQRGINIKAGFDGEKLALQVIDNWGTLTPNKAFEYLARHHGRRTLEEHPGGRGLYILWQLFDHFHINITSGEKTAVGGQICRKSAPIEGRTRGFDFFQISPSVRPNAFNPYRFRRRIHSYV